jgi:hypothetical protein
MTSHARDASFHIFRNKPEEEEEESLIVKPALAFSSLNEKKRITRGNSLSLSLTVLSDSINPVVRSTCGGFCALTTVNCAFRLFVYHHRFEKILKKALLVNIISAFGERKTYRVIPSTKEKMKETERHAKRNTNPSHKKTKKNATSRTFAKKSLSCWRRKRRI